MCKSTEHTSNEDRTRVSFVFFLLPCSELKMKNQMNPNLSCNLDQGGYWNSSVYPVSKEQDYGMNRARIWAEREGKLKLKLYAGEG